MKAQATCSCKQLQKLNWIASPFRFILFFAFFIFSFQSLGSENSVFKLHILKEPHSLDPQTQGSAVQSYLQQNLHRSLFKYENDKGLVPDLVESCSRSSKNLVLTCKLKKNLKWSDGTPLKAQEFVSAYEFLLKNPMTSGQALGLTQLKNAQAFIESKSPFSEVGVKALDERSLRFEFTEPQPEFEYNLCQTTLSPRPANEKQFSGPYQVKEWKKSQSLLLTKNPYYPSGNPTRPDVEFLFILDDATALKLYEKNQLDFLRRLPTPLYGQWQDKTDFKSFEVLRFDYFGFNPDLDSIEQRKQLSESLDYLDLQKIFQSKGRPGCVALPANFFAQDKIPCLDFKEGVAPPKLSWPKDLVIGYSAQGGDDHRRLAEWLQSQWKKRLNLNFRIQAMENKVFISQLRDKPTTVFRKGVTLDRPTCLSAVEIFSRQHPENFLKIDSPEYEKIISELRVSSKKSQQKALCSKAVNWLLSRYSFIPAGRFDFFTLLKPNFEGLVLNRMNQLNLENLKAK